MQKKNQKYLIAGVAILGIMLLVVAGPMFLSVADSFDKSSYTLQYDAAGTTDACKNIDVEWETHEQVATFNYLNSVKSDSDFIKTMCGANSSQVNFNNGVFSLKTPSAYSTCYQENANTAVGCAGANSGTGTYSITGIYTCNLGSGIDGGWQTGPIYFTDRTVNGQCTGYCASAGYNDIYITYRKPAETVGAVWQKARMVTVSPPQPATTYTTWNDTIPKSCLDFNTNTLLLRVRLGTDGSTYSPFSANYQCQDSTGWITISRVTATSCTFSGLIEEGMFWQISQPTTLKLKYTVPRETIPSSLHLRENSCPIPNGYTIFHEAFAAGSTISKTSLRYPVNYFCTRRPVEIINADTNSVNVDEKNIYQKIVNEETIQVPTGMIYVLYYIGIAPSDISVCAEGSYNVEKKACEINPSIMFVCSQGVFDPATGRCNIPVESYVYLCPEGGRYDVSQQKCIFNPPVQAVCPDETLYNINTKLCEFTPATKPVCNFGTTYNGATGNCEYTPETAAICSTGLTYNANTNKCEYVPSTAAVCQSGTTYNSVTNKCEYTPSTQAVCSSGTTYNSALNRCEYTPASGIVCPTGYVYNITIDKCQIFPTKTISCPGGYAYDTPTDKCIKYPASVAVCPTSTTWNNVTGLCEYMPSTAAVCGSGTTYNSVTNKCEYTPSTAAVCEGSYTFNSATNKCEYKPADTILCNPNYVYNTVTDKCEYKPNTVILCSGGTWNEVEKRCEAKQELVCTQGVYDSTLNSCIYNPDVSKVCTVGQLNSDGTACIMTPDLRYLCINGEVTKVGTETVCTIIPQTVYTCTNGAIYNETSGKCELWAEEIVLKQKVEVCPEDTTYNEQTTYCESTPETRILCDYGYTYSTTSKQCETRPETANICDEGANYNAGSGKCEVIPETQINCAYGKYDAIEKVCLFAPPITYTVETQENAVPEVSTIDSIKNVSVETMFIVGGAIILGAGALVAIMMKKKLRLR